MLCISHEKKPHLQMFPDSQLKLWPYHVRQSLTSAHVFHQKEEEKQKFIFGFFFLVLCEHSDRYTQRIYSNDHRDQQQFSFLFQSVSARKTAVWVSQLKVQCLQFAHKAVLYSKSCSIQQKVKHLLQTLYNPWDEPKVKRKISKSREILKFQNSFDQPRKVQHPNNF